MKQTEISVIIPFLNEEENLPLITAALEDFIPTVGVPVEVVFVNFGSHAAIRAGLLHASAPNCVWLSAYLQEPLEIISEVYKRIREGYDLVMVQKNHVKVSRS